MNQHPFLGGMGLGMMAGVMLTSAAMSNRRQLKRKAKKAGRMVSDLASDFTDSMGF
ncbi:MULTISPECIES: hypothetical protein [unclassified Flavonifractor]|uniref:hypothetical protein n=1 Tax=Flavonifractor sp. An92 TaxID=1965666 RepID=UPI0013021FF3|nr:MULTISPECIES: hypothetical protein [unclassified Flavonifractor]